MVHSQHRLALSGLTSLLDLCMSIQDLSEAEKQAEVLPIRVQQLYVATLLGKTEEANKLASEMPIQE